VTSNLKKIIDDCFSAELQQDVIALHRDLHRYPELSHNETQTQARLLAALNPCNTRWIERVGTGVVARLIGQDSNRPPVALRADMDALPIQEATGLPHASVHAGVMHACGHDVHMAWAIGAARLLSQSPPPTDVLLVFQPAEELGVGAKMIMASGLLPNNVTAIFGGHVDRRYDVGQVVLHPGVISSFSDRFKLIVHGRSAHAARPKEGHNPIPTLAERCLAIDAINNQLGDATNLITVTQLHSGDRHNIIPGTGFLEGTIRCLSAEKRLAIHGALSGLATTNAVDVHIDHVSPAIENANQLEPIARRAIHDALGPDGAVGLVAPNMASEDFGVYAQHFPAWFFRFGAKQAAGPFIPVHTPDFYADDATMFVGAMVLDLACRYAGECS